MSCFSQFQARDRGELILRFSILAAFIQALCVHTIPYVRLTPWKDMGAKLHIIILDVSLYSMDAFLVLAILCAIEFLMFWTALGPRGIELLMPKCVWLVAVVATVSILLHWKFVEWLASAPADDLVLSGKNDLLGMYPSFTDKQIEVHGMSATFDVCSNITGTPDNDDAEEWEALDESTTLLPNIHVTKSSATTDNILLIANHRARLFWKHVQLLFYPIDLLFFLLVLHFESLYSQSTAALAIFRGVAP